MNSPSASESQKWARSLDLLIDGSLPADEAVSLQQQMKADPALLALYLDKMRMESLLRDHAWKDAVLLLPQPKPTVWRVFTPRHLAWAAAALVLLSTAGLWLRFGPSSSGGLASAPALPDVQFSASSVFETASPSLPEDGQLRFGDGVIMEDGSVSIRMPSGVEAVLKSPSRFAITGPNRFKLDRGAAWFRVPETAKGFTVDLPDMEVVDLGTVFTVSVDDQEHQVHVEKGRVEVKQRMPGIAPQLLKTGEKLVRRANATTVQILSGSGLLDPQAMQEKAEIIFHESLAHVPNQNFPDRQPLVGSWQLIEGGAQVQDGRFAARDSSLTHLMGRFSRPVAPDENAVLLMTFKSVSPKSLFHSKGFAGISLFDGNGELFFIGDKSSDSYSWECLTYGKNYRGPHEQRRAYDMAVQGSQETFTLRYRQKNGRFEIFRGAGAQGLPIVRGKTDPNLRFDAIRVANGRGGDFSFEQIQVSVVKDSKN